MDKGNSEENFVDTQSNLEEETMKIKANVNLLVVCALVALPLMAVAQQYGFTRTAEIPVPEADLNVGGIGNMIAGVDLDGDGNLEIYLVNDNINDWAQEQIPRIYKLEFDGTDWQVVWSAVAPIPKQNTWPALTIGDLDKDSKPELLWGVVNFTETGNENPARILAYELTAAGSDDFGIAAGDTNFLPNSTFTIVPADSLNKNLRPTRFVAADVDNDGTDEVVFSDRKGNDAGYYFGVCSVDDIPDAGDGSETWTLEVSGKDFGDLSAAPIENKWDVAVIDSNIYTFCEVEISKLSYANGSWSYTALSPIAGGASFITSQVVDLDSDGTEEIIAGTYDWLDDAEKGVYLLQESGDTLKHTKLAGIGTGDRLIGGAHGDIDQDGYLDFVFGSRFSEPNASIFRLAYRGGDITAPANYEFTVIDSKYVAIEDGDVWSVINIVNIDDDAELEVLYTSSTSYGATMFDPGTSPPIIVLDYGEIIATEPVEAVPGAFALQQNYPNPFNPSTRISFTLNQAMDVQLVVYNLLGREIVSLREGYAKPGYNHVIWNGRSADGLEVPAGIYIARLNGSGHTQSIKMLLLK